VPPPLLGEHTRELLGRLGYDDAGIRALIETGAALVADPQAGLWAKVRPAEASATS